MRAMPAATSPGIDIEPRDAVNRQHAHGRKLHHLHTVKEDIEPSSTDVVGGIVAVSDRDRVQFGVPGVSHCSLASASAALRASARGIALPSARSRRESSEPSASRTVSRNATYSSAVAGDR
jgi:hypothetical protein